MATVRVHIDDENLKAPWRGPWLSIRCCWRRWPSRRWSPTTAIAGPAAREEAPSPSNWLSGLAAAPAGVPLPRPEVVTPKPRRGHHQGTLQIRAVAKPVAPPADAKQIPEFTKEKQPRYVTRPSKLLEDKTPPPQNAVPYGQGGSPSVPYSQSQAPPQSQGPVPVQSRRRRDHRRTRLLGTRRRW